jgi:hypothetical protein
MALLKNITRLGMLASVVKMIQRRSRKQSVSSRPGGR